MDGYEGKMKQSHVCVYVYLIKDNTSFCVCVCVFYRDGIGNLKYHSINLRQMIQRYANLDYWVDITVYSLHMYPWCSDVYHSDCMDSWADWGTQERKMQLNYSSTTALVIYSRLWLLKLATYEMHYKVCKVKKEKPCSIIFLNWEPDFTSL